MISAHVAILRKSSLVALVGLAAVASIAHFIQRSSGESARVHGDKDEGALAPIGNIAALFKAVGFRSLVNTHFDQSPDESIVINIAFYSPEGKYIPASSFALHLADRIPPDNLQSAVNITLYDPGEAAPPNQEKSMWRKLIAFVERPEYFSTIWFKVPTDAEITRIHDRDLTKSGVELIGNHTVHKWISFYSGRNLDKLEYTLVVATGRRKHDLGGGLSTTLLTFGRDFVEDLPR